VSILVPLCGDEPGLSERLEALCKQAYGGPVQIVFGAHDADDPAIAIARECQGGHRELAIDIRIDPRVHGYNRKISNLANMAELARHEVLIVLDSDIVVHSDYLSRIVADLQQPTVGAVTCLYYGVAGCGFWSRLSAMSINIAFLPNVIMALTFGLARPCFGATIALRRDLLKRIGGFQAFADCLADDYAIGEAVRAAGYTVAVPSLATGHVCCETSLRELLAHQLRYGRTIRSIDPVGYAGAIITHPIPLAAIALVIGVNDAVPLLVLACLSRLMVCSTIEHVFGVGRYDYWLLPLRDLLSFLVYVASFLGARVSWRGYSYRLAAHGAIVNDAKV
jgi:ceramide glucosyltransferase